MAKPTVHAELSIVPIGSASTSVGEYVANAIKAIRAVRGIRYEVTAMGTLIEADNIDSVLRAVKFARNAIFKQGVKRVELVLRIDERRDKPRTMREKLRSIQKYMKTK